MSSGTVEKGVMYQKRSCLNVGDRVLNGKYEVVRIIHAKGMANVYAVIDSNLGKQWCLKEIRKSEAGRRNIEYISLLQEANILRDLSNERIPRITEIENDGDSLFVVMDFLDGINLKDFIEKNGKVSEEIAVKWMTQIVQAMSYLHSNKSKKKPIFYRDMKPDNLMVRPNGDINIFDFGISIKVESPDQKPEYTLGTTGYVAPEQQDRNLPIDLRSDIFAMGRTFYFILTGVDPRSLMSPELIDKKKYMSSKSLKPIEEWSPEISPALIAIVNKCMEDNPEDRYQDCEELQYALETYKSSDVKNRSAAYRKVITSIVLLISGVIIMCGSIIPFTLDENKKMEEYEAALAVAEQSGLVDDYKKALDLNALDIRAYLGFIEATKVDGVFSKDEEKQLLDSVNPNLLELKELDGYGDLAYSLGRLYWFYYDDYNEQDEGKTLSIKWFEDAIASNCNVAESTIYYDLGIFKRDIAKSIKDSSDSGMYKNYWNNLIKAQESSTNDMVTIQTYISVSECISVYSYNLKIDGVTYEEVIEEVGILEYFVENYKVDESSDIISSLYDELSRTVAGLESRVNTVYGKSGGGV